MITRNIAVPIEPKLRPNFTSSPLLARMAAIALYHDSGTAKYLGNDAFPVVFALDNREEQWFCVYKIAFEEPMDPTTESFFEGAFRDDAQLLFLLKGVNFNSNWSANRG